MAMDWASETDPEETIFLVDPMTVCDSLAKDLCCLCCMVVFFGGLLETKTSANANYAKFDCFIGYLLLLLLGGW